MKIIKTRKAGVGMLAGIIFILACAALITASVIRTQLQAKGKLDIEACAINVNWNDKTKQMINLNNCYTYDLEEIKTNTKKAAINQIIDRVRDCWYEFGAGQKDPWGGIVVFQEPRCFSCFIFSIPKSIGEITHDEFLAEVNKRPEEEKKFLITASIVGSKTDKPYFFIEEMQAREGGILSLGVAELDMFTYFNVLVPEKDYGIVFWYVADKRARQILLGKRGWGFSFIHPTENARQRLSCSQYYYIPAK